MIKQQFSQPLLTWFDHYGRQDLPWQHPRSPYYVWLSEIMLQQTQVKTVIPYFLRFTERFPTLEALASADLDEVLALWSGLGYYSRARNLHRCAQKIVDEYQGIFPSTPETLTQLPGIGESTAAAIASLAFNQPTAILDGNVKRVLCRYFAIDQPPDQTAIKKQLWNLAQQCMDDQRCADYTQAIMDLGATCCTRTKPDCAHCPLQGSCQAYAQSKVEQLPVRAAKKVKPHRERHFILLQNEDSAIFLQKNEAKGVWGGLWCLPCFPELKDSQKWLEQTCAIEHFKDKPDIFLKHTFTHFHLQLKVYHYHINGKFQHTERDGRWLRQDEIKQVGLPKPISVILKQSWPGKRHPVA